MKKRFTESWSLSAIKNQEETGMGKNQIHFIIYDIRPPCIKSALSLILSYDFFILSL